MKLRRLRFEHFKRFREPLTLEGFADGLNLFAAPYDSGKSSVAEAIRAVRPAGVDSNTATNVPGDPVAKDLGRIRAFVAAVRGARR